jgi:hypothetical protein
MLFIIFYANYRILEIKKIMFLLGSKGKDIDMLKKTDWRRINA